MVKVSLRHYEALGMVQEDFSAWDPKFTRDQDGVPLPEYTIPRLKSFLDQQDDTVEVQGILDQIEEDPRAVAFELLAQRRLSAHLSVGFKDLLVLADEATAVGKLGKRLHERCSDMLFDQLTLAGQADLSVKGVREARLSECLTPGFNSTLQNKGKTDILDVR